MESPEVREEETEKIEPSSFDQATVHEVNRGRLLMVSEKGGRTENQDYALFDKQADVFVVVDGMGGYDNGALSAQVVGEGIIEGMKDGLHPVKMHHELAAKLREAGVRNGGAVYIAGRIEKKKLHLTHAGDCSLLIVDRRGDLREHIKPGRVAEGIRATDPGRATQITVRIENGDKIIGLTDGITDNTEIEVLQQVLKQRDIQKALRTVKEEAMKGMETLEGNKDNITLLVYEIVPK